MALAMCKAPLSLQIISLALLITAALSSSVVLPARLTTDAAGLLANKYCSTALHLSLSPADQNNAKVSFHQLFGKLFIML